MSGGNVMCRSSRNFNIPLPNKPRVKHTDPDHFYFFEHTDKGRLGVFLISSELLLMTPYISVYTQHID